MCHGTTIQGVLLHAMCEAQYFMYDSFLSKFGQIPNIGSPFIATSTIKSNQS